MALLPALADLFRRWFRAGFTSSMGGSVTRLLTNNSFTNNYFPLS